MRIYSDIVYAAHLLRQGEVVAFPTETVYGLGADALNPNAVLKIFELKQRPKFDPLIVHLQNVNQMSDYAEFQEELVNTLAKHFLPGPLSLVCKKKPIIPDLVTSGLDTVAIRIPANDIAQLLLQEFGGPVAAPSANLFGKLSPTHFEHVFKNFGDRVFILKGPSSSVGIESTILDITTEPPTILRRGGISTEAIEAVLGKVQEDIVASSNPKSPGQLKHHYSPNTPLMVIENLNDLKTLPLPKRFGLLLPSPMEFKFLDDHQMVTRILSSTNDLQEMAKQFFSILHELDTLELPLVVAIKVPNIGIGRAINDRLERASSH
ncbi:MAG: L-threonylcarbamoyladenylate synthase [bacterium]|nr:L-threonylcarbamoyladenylate synthase [bacterium]